MTAVEFAQKYKQTHLIQMLRCAENLPRRVVQPALRIIRLSAYFGSFRLCGRFSPQRATERFQRAAGMQFIDRPRHSGAIHR
jgi:hypothetical protein